MGQLAGSKGPSESQDKVVPSPAQAEIVGGLISLGEREAAKLNTGLDSKTGIGRMIFFYPSYRGFSLALTQTTGKSKENPSARKTVS